MREVHRLRSTRDLLGPASFSRRSGPPLWWARQRRAAPWWWHRGKWRWCRIDLLGRGPPQKNKGKRAENGQTRSKNRLTRRSARRRGRAWAGQPPGGACAAERGRPIGGIGKLRFVMGVPTAGQACLGAEMRPRSAREVKGSSKHFLDRESPGQGSLSRRPTVRGRRGAQGSEPRETSCPAWLSHGRYVGRR